MLDKSIFNLINTTDKYIVEENKNKLGYLSSEFNVFGNNTSAYKYINKLNDVNRRTEILREAYTGMDFDNDIARNNIASLLEDEYYGVISKDDIMKNLDSMISRAVGYEIKPKDFWEHTGNVFKSSGISLLANLGMAGLYMGSIGDFDSVQFQNRKKSLVQWMRDNGAEYRKDIGDKYTVDTYEGIQKLFSRMIVESTTQAPQMLVDLPLAALDFASGGLASPLTGVARAAFSAMMEGGSSMMDAVQAGFDDDTIFALGTIVGLLNGTIEKFGDDVILAPWKRFFGDDLMKPTKYTKKAMKDLIGMKALQFGKDMGKAMMSEVPTEMLQEAVSMFAWNVAYNFEKDTGKNMEDVLYYDKETFKNALVEIAKTTALSTPLMTASGSVLSGMKTLGYDISNLKAVQNFTPTEESAAIKNSKIEIMGSSKTDYKLGEDEKPSPLKGIKIGNRIIVKNATEAQKAAYNNAQKNGGYSYVEIEEISAEEAQKRKGKPIDTAKLKNGDYTSDKKLSLRSILAVLAGQYKAGNLKGYTLYDKNYEPTDDYRKVKYVGISSTKNDGMTVISVGQGRDTGTMQDEVFGSRVTQQATKATVDEDDNLDAVENETAKKARIAMTALAQDVKERLANSRQKISDSLDLIVTGDKLLDKDGKEVGTLTVPEDSSHIELQIGDKTYYILADTFTDEATEKLFEGAMIEHADGSVDDIVENEPSEGEDYRGTVDEGDDKKKKDGSVDGAIDENEGGKPNSDDQNPNEEPNPDDNPQPNPEPNPEDNPNPEPEDNPNDNPNPNDEPNPEDNPNEPKKTFDDYYDSTYDEKNSNQITKDANVKRLAKLLHGLFFTLGEKGPSKSIMSKLVSAAFELANMDAQTEESFLSAIADIAVESKLIAKDAKDAFVADVLQNLKDGTEPTNDAAKTFIKYARDAWETILNNGIQYSNTELSTETKDRFNRLFGLLTEQQKEDIKKLNESLEKNEKTIESNRKTYEDLKKILNDKSKQSLDARIKELEDMIALNLPYYFMKAGTTLEEAQKKLEQLKEEKKNSSIKILEAKIQNLKAKITLMGLSEKEKKGEFKEQTRKDAYDKAMAEIAKYQKEIDKLNGIEEVPVEDKPTETPTPVNEPPKPTEPEKKLPKKEDMIKEIADKLSVGKRFQKNGSVYTVSNMSDTDVAIQFERKGKDGKVSKLVMRFMLEDENRVATLYSMLQDATFLEEENPTETPKPVDEQSPKPVENESDKPKDIPAPTPTEVAGAIENEVDSTPVDTAVTGIQFDGQYIELPAYIGNELSSANSQAALLEIYEKYKDKVTESNFKEYVEHLIDEMDKHDEEFINSLGEDSDDKNNHTETKPSDSGEVKEKKELSYQNFSSNTNKKNGSFFKSVGDGLVSAIKKFASNLKRTDYLIPQSLLKKMYWFLNDEQTDDEVSYSEAGLDDYQDGLSASDWESNLKEDIESGNPIVLGFRERLTELMEEYFSVRDDIRAAHKEDGLDYEVERLGSLLYNIALAREISKAYEYSMKDVVEFVRKHGELSESEARLAMLAVEKGYITEKDIGNKDILSEIDDKFSDRYTGDVAYVVDGVPVTESEDALRWLSEELSKDEFEYDETEEDYHFADYDDFKSKGLAEKQENPKVHMEYDGVGMDLDEEDAAKLNSREVKKIKEVILKYKSIGDTSDPFKFNAFDFFRKFVSHIWSLVEINSDAANLLNNYISIIEEFGSEEKFNEFKESLVSKANDKFAEGDYIEYNGKTYVVTNVSDLRVDVVIHEGIGDNITNDTQNKYLEFSNLNSLRTIEHLVNEGKVTHQDYSKATVVNPFTKGADGMYTFDFDSVKNAFTSMGLSDRDSHLLARLFTVLTKKIQNGVISNFVRKTRNKYDYGTRLFNAWDSDEMQRAVGERFSKRNVGGYYFSSRGIFYFRDYRSENDDIHMLQSQTGAAVTIAHEFFHAMMNANPDVRSYIYKSVSEFVKKSESDKDGVARKVLTDLFDTSFFHRDYYKNVDELIKAFVNYDERAFNYHANSSLVMNQKAYAAEYGSMNEAMTELFVAWLEQSENNEKLNKSFGEMLKDFINRLVEGLTKIINVKMPEEIDNAYIVLFDENPSDVGRIIKSNDPDKPTIDQPFNYDATSGLYSFDVDSLAKAIEKASFGKIKEKSAKLCAKVMSIMPASTQDAIIRSNLNFNSGKFFMGVSELPVHKLHGYVASNLFDRKTYNLKTNGVALLDSANIILSKRSSVVTVLHEAFHLMMAYDENLRGAVYSKIRDIVMNKDGLDGLKKFIDNNADMFDGQPELYKRYLELLKGEKDVDGYYLAGYQEYEEIYSNGKVVPRKKPIRYSPSEAEANVDEVITRLYTAWFMSEKHIGINEGIVSVFKRVKEAFQSIYKHATGFEYLPVQLNDAFSMIYNGNITHATFMHYCDVFADKKFRLMTTGSLFGKQRDTEQSTYTKRVEHTSLCLIYETFSKIPQLIKAVKDAGIQFTAENYDKIYEILKSKGAFSGLGKNISEDDVHNIANAYISKLKAYDGSYTSVADKLCNAIAAFDVDAEKARKQIDEIFHGEDGIVTKILEVNKRIKYKWGSSANREAQVYKLFENRLKKYGKFTDKELEQICRYLHGDKTGTNQNILAMDDKLMKKFINAMCAKKADGTLVVRSALSGKDNVAVGPLITLLNIANTDPTVQAIKSDTIYTDYDFFAMSQAILFSNQNFDFESTNNDMMDIHLKELVENVGDGDKSMANLVFQMYESDKSSKDGKKYWEEVYKEAKKRADAREKERQNLEKTQEKLKNLKTRFDELIQKLKKAESSTLPKEDENSLREVLNNVVDTSETLAEEFGLTKESIASMSVSDLAKTIHSVYNGIDGEVARLEQDLTNLIGRSSFSAYKKTGLAKYIKQLYEFQYGQRDIFKSKNERVNAMFGRLYKLIKTDSGNVGTQFSLDDIYGNFRDDYEYIFTDAKLWSTLEKLGILEKIDSNSYKIKHNISSLTIAETATLIDAINEVADKSWKAYQDQKAIKKEKISRVSAAIKNGLVERMGMTEADAQAYIDRWMNRYRPASSKTVGGKLSKLYDDIGVSLMSRRIQRVSPELYAYFYGGIINGEEVTDSFNRLLNDETANYTRRISGMYQKFASLFNYEGSTQRELSQLMADELGRYTESLGLYNEGKDVFTEFQKKYGTFGEYSKSDKKYHVTMDYLTDEKSDLRAIAEWWCRKMNRMIQLEEDILMLEADDDYASSQYDKRRHDEMEREYESIKNVLNGFTPDGEPVVKNEAQYTMQQMMGIYVLSHQDDAMNRLLDGGWGNTDNMTFAELLWVVDRFKDNDMSKYKQLADFIEADAGARYDDIAEVYFRTTGKILDRIQNYFMLVPLDENNMVSRNISLDGVGDTTSNELNEAGTDKKAPMHKFTYSRTHTPKTVDINLIDNYLYSVKNQEHYIAFKEKFDDIDELFNGKDGIDNALRTTMGKRYEGMSNEEVDQNVNLSASRYESFANQLDRYLGNIAGSSSKTTSKLGEAIAKGRSNMAVARLAGNLVSIASNYTMQFVNIRKNGFARANAAFLDKEGSREIVARFAKQLLVRNRDDVAYRQSVKNSTITGLEKKMNDLFGGSDVSLSFKNRYNALIGLSFDAMQAIDTQIANATFVATFQRLLEENSTNAAYASMYNDYINGKNLDSEGASAYERAMAEIAVQETLDVVQSQNAKDNANIYSDNDTWVKGVIMFTSQANKIFNLVADDVADVIRNYELYGIDSDAVKEMLVKGLGDIMAIGMIATTTAFLKGRFIPDDDQELFDDSWWLDTGMEIFAEMFSNVPLIGQASSALTGDYGVQPNIATYVSSFMGRLTEDEPDKAKHRQKMATATKNLAKSTADTGMTYLFQSPVLFGQNIYRSVYDGENIRFNPLNMINKRWADYLEVK